MGRWLVLLLFAFSAARAENYCFGFLNAHPERTQIPEAQANEIQRGHLTHMERMGQMGKLLAAGPMVTTGGPRGVLIYRCSSVAEAQQWTSGDPAVQAKRLQAEFWRWLGPDKVGEPLMAKLKADPKAKYDMVRLPLIMFRKTAKWVGEGPDEVLQAHGPYVTLLLKEGKLRMAGPFADDQGRPRSVPGVMGLYVFAAMPLEEAKALAEADPLVKQGYATVEAHMWMVADEVIPGAKGKGTSMLGSEKLMAFVGIKDPERAKAFYRDTLGLKLVSEEKIALVFDANGTMLRATIAPDLTPLRFTVLGWQVPDIVATAKKMIAGGVKFEHFPGLNQSDLGVWKAHDGTQVAWFKDPDGNILSVTEFVH